MNKAPKSQTREIDVSYCRFGWEAILGLLDGLEKNIDGVIKNEDIECVHKTRVASRKLRALLPLFQFCFPKKSYKKWFKQIKKVTRLLGQARDLDVQIAFIEDYMQKIDTSESECLNILLRKHKKCRDKVQPYVAEGLDVLKASGILQDIRSFCEGNIHQQTTVAFDSKQVLQKAYCQISFRLDDFLSFAEFVKKEDEILKHHEMRISAKNLRYTMEFFSRLYPDKLQNEIENIKAYQDILGEKHDFEVWIESIPEFLGQAKSLRKKIDEKQFYVALNNFLNFVKAERRQRYLGFVQLWTENQRLKFFDKLREVPNSGLKMDKEKAIQALANPQVKVAILADVHANLHALEQVIKDAEERSVNLFVNAGDSIGFGPYPNESISLLCEKNVFSILGNYDLEVIEKKANAKGEKKLARDFARKELTPSSESYLACLPRELRLEASGKKMLVTHGSPKSIEEHIYRDTPVEQLRVLADYAEADVIIFGHSHEQFALQAHGVYFINPGSVGRPGDGNPQTAYAILTFNPLNVELIRLDYAVEASADALLKKGLPESFAQMLLRGVSLDTITEEDDSKKESSIENCRFLVEKSGAFAKKFGPDFEHYSQVTQLALQFFDGLKKVIQLTKRERCWLECAAILHDIGLSAGRKKHNKESAKIILHDTKLPFTSVERQIIASIARYHRNGLPKNRHYNLTALDKTTKQKIKILSGLLRVADALDYTHQSNVQSVEFKVGAKQIAVKCVTKTPSILEEQAFSKKKDLFENWSGKKLVLIWKQK